MANALILSDPFAQLVWRMYLVRAESTLSAAPTALRRELISDITNHVAEKLSVIGTVVNERKRLKEALASLGDPDEFIRPLLAAAQATPTTKGRITSLMHRGGRILGFSAATVSLLFALVLCGAIFTAAIASLVDPTSYGIFNLGENQIRIGGNADLTTGAYHQMLTPVRAVLLATASVTAFGAMLFAVRGLLLRIVALTYTVGLRVLL